MHWQACYLLGNETNTTGNAMDIYLIGFYHIHVDNIINVLLSSAFVGTYIYLM